ncbi:hypothetical protein NKI86_18125 [Mesorhizobium sp. M0320]|uniref:hypothetical protein n=1 Tax=Mesorhizobium sp. M0320 TaxID=2956936 RepID=UPI003338CFE9
MKRADPGGFAPGKLWGLLEMLEVKARPFVMAADLLAQMMIYGRDPNADRFAPEMIEGMKTMLLDLKEQLEKLEMSRPTLASVERLLVQLDKGWPPAAVQGGMIELRGRMMDDLGGEFLLALSLKEKEMYQENAPWGPRVSGQFPSLQDEIREASKCLALARYTASAFHSLRCLEGGIIAMSRCLGIPDPTRGHDRNWTSMLRGIDTARKAKWNASALMFGDGQTFDDLYGALAGMQNPWRNATMHLEHSFNEEQAKHVFDIVGGFMRRVAERMDESGLPLA